MTRSSPASAERCPTCGSTDSDYRYSPPFRACGDSWHGDYQLRRATDSGGDEAARTPDRETIAQIIDPYTFKQPRINLRKPDYDRAYAKADAILALLSPDAAQAKPERIAELQYEAGMYQSLYELAKGRLDYMEAKHGAIDWGSTLPSTTRETPAVEKE